MAEVGDAIPGSAGARWVAFSVISAPTLEGRELEADMAGFGVCVMDDVEVDLEGFRIVVRNLGNGYTYSFSPTDREWSFAG